MTRLLVLALVGLLVVPLVGALEATSTQTPIWHCGSILDGTYPGCCPSGYVPPVTCQPRPIE